VPRSVDRKELAARLQQWHAECLEAKIDLSDGDCFWLDHAQKTAADVQLADLIPPEAWTPLAEIVVTRAAANNRIQALRNTRAVFRRILVYLLPDRMKRLIETLVHSQLLSPPLWTVIIDHSFHTAGAELNGVGELSVVTELAEIEGSYFGPTTVDPVHGTIVVASLAGARSRFWSITPEGCASRSPWPAKPPDRSR
jgi:hypothetical protein